MQKTLEAINALQASGVIADYALAGAVAAMYYTEPTLTEDVDLLVALDAAGSGKQGTGLLTLTPIVDYLNALGYHEWRKEGIVVEGWPVQFLPVADPLDAEALAGARVVEIEFSGGKIAARILQAEHLVAIALRTGRPKDSIRILQLLEADAVDEATLETVLARPGLTERWEQFRLRHGLGGRTP